MDYQQMNTKSYVEHWIGNRQSFYFFLPDGPYGRPFDNQYSITDIRQDGLEFKINFSDRITLHFLGDLELREEGLNLLISGFRRLEFAIEGKQQRAYDYGEVVLSGF
jgi:hypothetical protein